MDVDVTSKEAFRIGFLTRCAEEGLTGDALQARIKQAGILGTIGQAAGLPAAVGLGTGAALGYGAAKLTEPDITEDDIKAQELADTYRVYANKMRAARLAAKYRRNPLHLHS
ncbi:hypothetical protein EBZ39_01820 [bacterium]|nr:hypothetical protein [bacterium]